MSLALMAIGAIMMASYFGLKTYDGVQKVSIRI